MFLGLFKIFRVIWTSGRFTCTLCGKEIMLKNVRKHQLKHAARNCNRCNRFLVFSIFLTKNARPLNQEFSLAGNVVQFVTLRT